MIGSISKVQIRSNCLILYDQPEYFGSGNAKYLLNNRMQLEAAQKTAYTGKFSIGAMKRLARCIDLMVQSIEPKWIYNEVTKKRFKHRLSFVTLTVSQQENITAKDCYEKAFKHYLQWLRRTMKVNTYVWKAEIQKRGQIHYHITTPSFIPWQRIRDKWNNLQQQNGWTDDYYKLHGHYNPNSTDIHEVYKIKDISNYLKKEYCKAIQNDIGEGKCWDASDNLKGHKYFTVDETHQINLHISELMDRGIAQVEKLEQCMIVKFTNKPTTEILTLDKTILYNNFIDSIRKAPKE